MVPTAVFGWLVGNDVWRRIYFLSVISCFLVVNRVDAQFGFANQWLPQSGVSGTWGSQNWYCFQGDLQGTVSTTPQTASGTNLLYIPPGFTMNVTTPIDLNGVSLFIGGTFNVLPTGRFYGQGSVQADPSAGGVFTPGSGATMVLIGDYDIGFTSVSGAGSSILFAYYGTGTGNQSVFSIPNQSFAIGDGAELDLDYDISIHNNGVITLTTGADIVGLDSADLYVGNLFYGTGTLNINTDFTFPADSYRILVSNFGNGTLNIGEGATFTNNDSLGFLGDRLNVYGHLVNNRFVQLFNGNHLIGPNGKITNNETVMHFGGSFVNNGQIVNEENFFLLGLTHNNGLITNNDSLFNGDFFINNDSIVNNAYLGNLDTLDNNHVIHNGPNGTLYNFKLLINDSLLTNHGNLVNLENSVLLLGNDKSQLQNYGVATNMTDGKISLARKIHNHSGATFENFDTVDMYDPFSQFVNEGNLDNKEEGTVIVRGSFQNAAGADVDNEGAFRNYKVLTNSGIFDNLPNTGSEVTNYGTFTNQYIFNNSGAFVNETCALGIDMGVFSNQASGILVNKGLWKLSSNTSNYNNGTVNNEGVWWKDMPPANANLNSNNGIVVREVINCNNPVPNAVDNNTPGGWTIGATWYLDQGLTQPAGAYHAGNNTFTPSIPQDTFLAFFQITPPGCSPYVVSQQMNIQTFPALQQVTGSNATNASKGRLEWTYPQGFVDNSDDYFRIYRDHDPTPIATINAVNVSNNYFDNGAIPGVFHSYKLEYFKTGCTVSPPVEVLARGRADGQISGDIKTPGGVGIKEVEVCAFPDPGNNQALRLNGGDDKVAIPAFNQTFSTLTIEAWVNPDGIQPDWTGILLAADSPYKLGLNFRLNNELGYHWGENLFWYVSSGLTVPSGQWSHVALVVEPDKATLYLNGVPFVNQAAHTPTPLNVSSFLGVDPNFPGGSRAFNGRMDEVRIWNTARSAEEIKMSMDHILKGDETGLIAFYRFNADTLGSTPLAADYVTGGTRHAAFMGNAGVDTASALALGYCGESVVGTGNYSINQVVYGANGSDFRVFPFKEEHGFVQGPYTPNNLIPPPITVMDLNEQSKNKTGVNFIDTTTFTISGTVLFSTFGTGNSIADCLQDSVLVTLKEAVTGAFVDSVRTDENGKYDLVAPQAGNYRLELQYLDHTFQLDPNGNYQYTQNGNTFGPVNVDIDLIDVNFENTTTRNIYFKVRGGCENVLYDDVQVRIYSSNSRPNGCVDLTFWTGPSNNIDLNLPAQQYKMEIKAVKEAGNATPNQGIGQTRYPLPYDVDISTMPDTGAIIWHKPAEILVTYPQGVEVINCNDTFKLMEQFKAYNVGIQVAEVYPEFPAGVFPIEASCPVDTANIIIVDPASEKENASQEELTIGPNDFGQASYVMFPTVVSSVPPFKQPLNISAEVVPTSDEVQASLANWKDSITVLGSATQPGSFITVSPELPRMILRDPPGDQSKSYVSTNTTNCVRESFSIGTSESGDFYEKIRIGAKFKIGTFAGLGAGVTFSSESQIWSDINLSLSSSSRNLTTEDLETCLTFKEALETSTDEALIGAPGNVYVSSAYNIAFSPTVNVYLDTIQGCLTVVDSAGFIVGRDSVLTTFYRSEYSIRNTLIPNLELLRDNEPLETDPNGPFYPLTREGFRYQNQINIWNQILTYNENLVNNALSSPDAENITFDGAAGPISRGISRTNSSTLTIDYNLFFDESFGLESGIDLAGTGGFVGSTLRWRQETSEATATTNRTEQESGFVLDDNDANDYIEVVAAVDPVYNTPVFKIGTGGRTSCPYEGLPTGPLDIFDISLDVYQQYNVPVNLSANFFFFHPERIPAQYPRLPQLCVEIAE